MTTLNFSIERMATPTGPMMIVTDAEQHLRALDWEDHLERMQKLLARHYGKDGVRLHEVLGPSPVRRALDAYFAGAFDALQDVPTATNGTPFQQSVWRGLRRIPAGQTLSYGALAASIGKSNAVRAVGFANGANPIAIVVPCHRVIGADKSLTGFGGGIERKRWLLTHEGALADQLVLLQ